MNTGDRPAFPVSSDTFVEGGSAIASMQGLTKREYYAGLVMQGALAGRKAWPQDEAAEKRLAAACVDLADALIAELGKKP